MVGLDHDEIKLFFNPPTSIGLEEPPQPFTGKQTSLWLRQEAAMNSGSNRRPTWSAVGSAIRLGAFPKVTLGLCLESETTR
jgi:hypothetical protein